MQALCFMIEIFFGVADLEMTRILLFVKAA